MPSFCINLQLHCTVMTLIIILIQDIWITIANSNVYPCTHAWISIVISNLESYYYYGMAN
jgi:hypothetical protein